MIVKEKENFFVGLDNISSQDMNCWKYPNDNETRIIIATLKPKGTVTTAPKIKE